MNLRYQVSEKKAICDEKQNKNVVENLGFQGSPHFLLYPSEPPWQKTLKVLNHIGLGSGYW